MKFPLALGQYLSDNRQIQKIILCLDDDEPGRVAARAIRSRLEAYDVVDNPPRRVNATGTLYAQDIEDIKGALTEIWQSQRSILLKAPYLSLRDRPPITWREVPAVGSSTLTRPPASINIPLTSNS